MENQHRSRRDLIQNIVITLLTLTAVGLFAQSQFYTLGLSAGSSYLSRLTGTAEEPVVLPHQAPALVAPVQIAVSNSYGRHADTALTTAHQEFEPLGTLLGEVLGSARHFTNSSHKAFFHALTHGPSVYYDFLTPMPLSILAALMGGAAQDDSLFARRLVVTESSSGRVTLFLWDDGERWLQASTSVSRDSLMATISRYEMGNAAFAMDLPDAESLAPLSLLPHEPEDLPVLTAAAPIGSSDRILSALNFNPHTNLRYLEPDDTEVIIEGERSIRLSTGGAVTYQSGGDNTLTIPASGSAPDLRGSIAGADLLLRSLLDDSNSAASLWLSGITPTEAGAILTFDYQSDGVPIRFSDNRPAAELTLRGNVVTELTLRRRHYTSFGQPSLLLPPEQAIAVAVLNKGAELSIGYQDRGSETVSACWLTS